MLETKSENLMNQIDETESKLAAKLTTLESRVEETVQDVSNAAGKVVEIARDKVNDTVEKVQDTVQQVKETLDLRTYVKKYPWPMMAGAVGVGIAIHYWTEAAGRNSHRPRTSNPSTSSRGAMGVFRNVAEKAMTQSLVPMFNGILRAISRELPGFGRR